jgi:hypothetical protein
MDKPSEWALKHADRFLRETGLGLRNKTGEYVPGGVTAHALARDFDRARLHGAAAMREIAAEFADRCYRDNAKHGDVRFAATIGAGIRDIPDHIVERPSDGASDRKGEE